MGLRKTYIELFRDNPVARMTLGIEPANSRRRRGAVFSVCFPTLLWAAIWVCFGVIMDADGLRGNRLSIWLNGSLLEKVQAGFSCGVATLVPWIAVTTIWVNA